MGTISDKLTYLNTTKSQLKDMINYGLDDENKITSSTTFREYVSSIFNAFLEALRTPDTLFTNLPKITSTGSNITLNDTANAPMRIMLNATDITQDGTPTPSSPQEIHTISGDNTLVVNGNNIFNGYAKVNSTFTNSIATALQHFKDTGEYAVGYPDTPANNKLLSSQLYMTAFIPVHEGITYTAVPHLPRTANYNFAQIFFLDDNGNIISYSPRWTEVAYTHTVAFNEKYMLLSVRIDETYPINTTAEVVIGATAPTSYEPYISQEADIDLSSKQLFNKNNSTSNYYLAQDGTPVSNSNYDYTEYISIKPDTYYMSTGMATGTGDAPSRCYYDKNKNFIIGYKHGNATDILNASPSNAFYMRESVKKVDVDTIKIYQAPYYDYGFCGSIGNYENIPIRTSGKNLLPVTNQDFTINNVRFRAENGSIILNGTASANVTGFIMHTDNYFPITLEAGTYYLKRNLTNRSVGLVKANETVVVSLSGTSTATSTTFTLSEKTTLYLFFYIASGTAITNEAWNIMISKEDADYEPYGSNEWYIKKNIGKVVLDGTETNWAMYGESGKRKWYLWQAYFINKNIPKPFTNYIDKSNRFKVSQYISGAWTNNMFGWHTSANALLFDTDFGESLSDWTTWLASNNVIVYYAYSTPTYTPITGTLAEQLENVYQLLKSYKGVTNISQVNNDLSFELDVEAVEDLE